jgi:hypothetical protein
MSNIDEIKQQALQEARIEIQEMIKGLPEKEQKKILSEIGKPFNMEAETKSHNVYQRVGNPTTEGIRCKKDVAQVSMELK